MTDVPSSRMSVPSRLGLTARLEDGGLVFELVPQREILHHGVVRASVLSWAIDAAAGVVADTDPDVWTLTSDMSVRMRPLPAPGRIRATNTVLRKGRRSYTIRVELTTEEGAQMATGAVGFVSIPRKDSDPPKLTFTPETAANLFRSAPRLSRPLREEAGIEVIDPVAGVVQVEVTPELRNPAGTLQGAMVALLAEAATEDLVSTRFESPVVVTDLDIRYLARAQNGPVRTRSILLGTGPDAPVQVELIDTSTGTLTTLVYARASLPIR